jgi:hypothetical protein
LKRKQAQSPNRWAGEAHRNNEPDGISIKIFRNLSKFYLKNIFPEAKDGSEHQFTLRLRLQICRQTKARGTKPPGQAGPTTSPTRIIVENAKDISQPDG